MPERRYAADGEAGGIPGLCSVGLRNGLTRPGTKFARIDAVTAAHEHYERIAAGDENQRLHDLVDAASNRPSGIGSSAGPFREAANAEALKDGGQPGGQPNLRPPSR